MPLVKHYLPEEYPLDSLPDTIRAAVEEVADSLKPRFLLLHHPHLPPFHWLAKRTPT